MSTVPAASALRPALGITLDDTACITLVSSLSDAEATPLLGLHCAANWPEGPDGPLGDDIAEALDVLTRGGAR